MAGANSGDETDYAASSEAQVVQRVPVPLVTRGYRHAFLPVLFLLLAACIRLCCAAKGVLPSRAAGAGNSSSLPSYGAAAAAATAAACGLAATWAMRRPHVTSSSAQRPEEQVAMGESGPPPARVPRQGKGRLLGFSAPTSTMREQSAPTLPAVSSVCIPSADDAGAYGSDAGAYGSGDDSASDSEAEDIAVDRGKNGKLWTKEQFPEGTQGAMNWDIENLKAAQDWECPCPDRRNCIGAERIKLLDLAFYRKHWRLQVAPNEGGQRDSCRKEMTGHYDMQSRTCSRSFVVAGVGDCCAAASALAKGLSFAHYAASRADLRKGRVWHAGRAHSAAALESQQRVHLRAEILAMRESMEGPKGGSDPNDKWHTDYIPIPKRWKAYKKARTDAGLPVIGSQSLFREEWLAAQIVEGKSCGHAKCTRCGRLDALEEKHKGRKDKEKEMQQLRVCAAPVLLCVAAALWCPSSSVRP